MHSKLNLSDLSNIFNKTLVEEGTNSVLVFLCMLSAFTRDNQFNMLVNGASSSGKSYMVDAIVRYFPDESKKIIAVTSPTALFYENAVFDKDRKAHIIDLRKKILYFQDLPHSEVMARLRPLLSHDNPNNNKELKIAVTDRTKDGEGRQRVTFLKGYPAFIACTANLHLDIQESSRALIISPESSIIKNTKAIRDSIHKRGILFKETLTDEESELMTRIQELYNKPEVKIVFPNSKLELYTEELFVRITGSVDKDRIKRDIERFLDLICTTTFLNYDYRLNAPGNRLEITQEDINQVAEYWAKIAKVQMMGVSMQAISFYKNYIVPAFEKHAIKLNGVKIGVRVQDITRYYKEVNESYLEANYLKRNILPTLHNADILSRVQDPDDGRGFVYAPRAKI